MPKRSVIHPIARRFGAAVRRRRLQRGLTLKVAARRAGISTTYLGFIEHGQNVPTLNVVVELAAVLGVEPAELVREVTELPATVEG